MARVVFMGTPDFAVPALNALHGGSAGAHSVVGVYTQADRPAGRGLGVRPPPVKARALELGLPVAQPERLSAPGEYDRLQALRPDVIVVVAYGQILKTDVLRLPRLGCVNIHSSLLPRWRGAAPIQRAVLEGDAETGVTTMRLVEKLDAGAILLQARTPIGPDDTAGSVHDRLARMGAELILPTLAGLESGTLPGREQDEGQVTYAAKLDKAMEWLNPDEPAEALDRRVRALNPWPGTSLWIRGKDDGEPAARLKILSVRAHPGLPGPRGQVFERAGMLLLGTSAGSLELRELQWEGKRPVEPQLFINGLKGPGRDLPLQTVVKDLPQACPTGQAVAANPHKES